MAGVSFAFIDAVGHRIPSSVLFSDCVGGIRMKKVLIATSALALTSCSVPTIESQQSPNGTEMRVIAIVDGCKVWKIDAGMTWVYTTICPPASDAATSYDESCGKNCTRNVEIQTNRLP